MLSNNYRKMSTAYTARNHLFTNMQETPSPNGLCHIVEAFRDYAGNADLSSLRDTCKTIRGQTAEERMVVYEPSTVLLNPECVKRAKINSTGELSVLPHGLRELTFGFLFDQPLEPGTLPVGLRKLKFGSFFNQPILPGVLPEGLQELEFGFDFNQLLELGVLPSGLKELKFSDMFDQPIHPGVLPNSLQKLSFGYDFARIIEPGTLPSGLQELVLNNKYI